MHGFNFRVEEVGRKIVEPKRVAKMEYPDFTIEAEIYSYNNTTLGRMVYSASTAGILMRHYKGSIFFDIEKFQNYAFLFNVMALTAIEQFKSQLDKEIANLNELAGDN